MPPMTGEVEHSWLVRSNFEAFSHQATQEEALKALLGLVPVVHRDFLDHILPQPKSPRLISWAQAHGIGRADLAYGPYPREKLLWSPRFTRAVKGKRTATLRSWDYYHRCGWNPVVAPLALHRLALLMPHPSILLLGRDLTDWAHTFCKPRAWLPYEWQMEDLGNGVGMLLVLPEHPESPEQWVFYIEPAAKLRSTIQSLVESIGTMLEARLHFGKRVQCTLLVGFSGDGTPNTNHAKIHLDQALNLMECTIRDRVEIASIVGTKVGIWSAMSLGDRPANWRYYECVGTRPLKWTRRKSAHQ